MCQKRNFKQLLITMSIILTASGVMSDAETIWESVSKCRQNSNLQTNTNILYRLLKQMKKYINYYLYNGTSFFCISLILSKPAQQEGWWWTSKLQSKRTRWSQTCHLLKGWYKTILQRAKQSRVLNFNQGTISPWKTFRHSAQTSLGWCCDTTGIIQVYWQ